MTADAVRRSCLLAAGLAAVSMAAILAVSGVTNAFSGDHGKVVVDPIGIRQAIGTAEDGAVIFVEDDLPAREGIEVVPLGCAPGPGAALESRRAKR